MTTTTAAMQTAITATMEAAIQVLSIRPVNTRAPFGPLRRPQAFHGAFAVAARHS